MSQQPPAFIDACVQGRVTDVEAAVRSGVSPDTVWRGVTAIHWAVQYEQDEVVAVLLALGAEADRADEDDCAFRPLHTAAGAGTVPIVRQLLEAGADPNSSAPANGLGTPLHNAAAYGELECLQLLVTHGGDPTSEDEDGLTPADYARENGHAAVLEWLDRRGDDRPAS